MEIENAPNLRKNRYPARIMLSVSNEVKTKLDYLKKEKNKDIPELLRILIDNFLKVNNI